jgi:hypothetical protein
LILEKIAKNSDLGLAQLRSEVYTTDPDLGEILTELLRSGMVAFVTLPRGEIGLGLTPQGFPRS